MAEKKALHSKAMRQYMAKGTMPEGEEFKDMQVIVEQDGGMLVTPEMSSEIVQKVFETSPMRQIADVQTISTDALEILEDLELAEAVWVGETQARNKTGTPKFNKITIPIHELSAMPAATQKILDDAAFNIEAWLSGKVSQVFSLKENTSFVVGDGDMKPRGFLNYAEGTGFNQVERLTTAVADVIDEDDLMDLRYSVKGPYQINAVWLMQRLTQKAIRKLKDDEGRYIWQPGLQLNQPDLLIGKPIVEAEDMQAYVTGGDNDNKQAIAFGDFKQGYQIVDRIGIRVIRDVYTAKPYTLFYTTKRVGGGVKNFEAIKVLKVKAG
jgi:HK97 family phage major capsid protein